jgi:hypothetical protein
MCPSTDSTEAQRQFAADVLTNLLQRIEIENQKEGRDPFVVSHAWTEGPLMFLVYTTPPSGIAWGLFRDTRQSIIDPGPWQPEDDAALYYFLLDLEEGRVSPSFQHPGEPDTIYWHGLTRYGLPLRPSDIPEPYRYTPPAVTAPRERPEQDPPVVEPRQYGNPT